MQQSETWICDACDDELEVDARWCDSCASDIEDPDGLPDMNVDLESYYTDLEAQLKAEFPTETARFDAQMRKIARGAARADQKTGRYDG